MSKKKSAYQTVAEAMAFGGLKNAKLSTKRVDGRRLSVDEIKQHLREEFGKAKSASDVDVLDNPKGWGDDDLVKQVNWVKELDLKEAVELLVPKEDK